MRNFNEDEKEILTYIVNEHLGFAKTLSFRLIEVSALYDKMAKDLDVVIEINSKTKSTNIKSDKTGIFKLDGKLTFGNEQTPGLFQQITNLLYKTTLIISLLDYLEKNHLIYFYPFYEKLPVLTFNKDYQFKNKSHEIGFLVTNLFDHIYKDLDKTIFPTPELIEFVKNNFKDKEQLRHNTNFWMQWLAIIVALLLGVVSVFDDKIKDWFGLAKNSNSVKQQVNSSNSDTLTDNQRQITIKNSTDSGLLKSKLPPTDTTKKQISVENFKKTLSRDTLKK